MNFFFLFFWEQVGERGGGVVCVRACVCVCVCVRERERERERERDFCFCGGFCRCFEVDDDCGFVAISLLVLGSIGGVLGMLACRVFFFVLLWVFFCLAFW